MDLNDRLYRRNFHGCSTCFYRTESILLMINHVRDHHKIQRTSGKVFNCSNELNQYKCGECDYRTPLRANLKRHVCSTNSQENIDLVETYNCENCYFQTSSYLLLGKHIYRDCENVINNWDQTVSESGESNDESEEDIDYFKKEIVEKGDKNETIEIEWYCGYCFFKTEFKRDLRTHIDQKHLSSEKSNMLNKSNNDTHTTKEIKWFKCNDCTFQSKQKGNLKGHILAKHTTAEKIEWFKCEKCSFQTKQKSSLNSHILFKHTAAEKINWFKCNNCTFQCKSKGYLKMHILSQHTAPEQIKWFKCKNCSYQTKTKSNLNTHILSKHTDPEKKKWFKCENCSFQTEKKHVLKRHILFKHTAPENVEWFECNYCLFLTKQKSNLKRHILHQHDKLAKK